MILRRWVTEKSSLSLPATLDQLPPNCSPTTRASVRRTTASFKSLFGNILPITQTGSIFCEEFFNCLLFSIFYIGQGGRGPPVCQGSIAVAGSYHARNSFG